MSRRVLVAVLLLLAPAALPAADVGDTVKESARTGGHAARDGALTVGRTVRDFFTKGPRAAKRTWKANAAETKRNAESGGHAVKSAAEEE
jgi:hypothetical protein